MFIRPQGVPVPQLPYIPRNTNVVRYLLFVQRRLSENFILTAGSPAGFPDNWMQGWDAGLARLFRTAPVTGEGANCSPRGSTNPRTGVGSPSPACTLIKGGRAHAAPTDEVPAGCCSHNAQETLPGAETPTRGGSRGIFLIRHRKEK